MPALGNQPLEGISAREIHTILEPIWSNKHDTARSVKQRIALVFDWAKGSGYYHSENPVNGIKKALPAVRRKVRHHAALPWQELPDLMLSKPVSGFSWGEVGRVNVISLGPEKSQVFMTSASRGTLNVTAKSEESFAREIFAGISLGLNRS